jgi:long-chain acyl-CoA synthetase
MAHAFERTVGYYLPMMAGSTVAYARSVAHLRGDLAAIRPMILLAVPHLFERMRAAIQTSAVKRIMLDWAATLGWRYVEASRRKLGRIDLADRLLWPLLRLSVAKSVWAVFGGRLRVAVSGGAPLDADLARFLIGLGLPLVEGYGLTEAAPVIAATALGESLPRSVGRPLPGIEVKLTERGELLARSPSVMIGYWRDPAGTARVLDSGGWLSTGDIAEIRDGRMHIVGRVSEMLVLSVGEKVNPSIVEAEITRDELFEQAAVFGQARPFLVATIVLNCAAWLRVAAQNGLDSDLPNSPLMKAKVLARLTHLLAGLPRHAQVRAVHLTLQPWTVEGRLLTPTLKIRRDIVQCAFASEIEGLYRDTRRVTDEAQPGGSPNAA